MFQIPYVPQLPDMLGRMCFLCACSSAHLAVPSRRTYCVCQFHVARLHNGNCSTCLDLDLNEPGTLPCISLMTSRRFSPLPGAAAWRRFPAPLLHLTALRKLSVVLGSPPLDAPELDDEEAYVEPEVPYEECAPTLPPGITRLAHLQELHVPHFKVPTTWTCTVHICTT